MSAAHATIRLMTSWGVRGIIADLRGRLVRWLAIALIVCALAAPSLGARLEVGPERPLKAPSAAAQIARDGDDIVIDPGTYFDCAVWSANHLTISGTGGAVVITDKTCQGKALFVIDGNDATVQHITFARARVVDGNGAGIRLEGRNLTVENSRFVDNQSGILAGDAPGGVIAIRDTEFDDNGACQGACAHALRVGRIGLLRVSKSRFSGTKLAHAIISNAQRNELIDNLIEDGPAGTSSYLVDLPSGGSILLDHNVLEKGPNSSNLRAAIMIGDGDELRPTSSVIAVGNRFTNDTGHPLSFITDWSSGAPVLDKNEFVGDITPIATSGVWAQRAKVLAGDIKAALRAMAVAAVHLIRPGLAWIRGHL
jgi:hypothetical protein